MRKQIPILIIMLITLIGCAPALNNAQIQMEPSLPQSDEVQAPAAVPSPTIPKSVVAPTVKPTAEASPLASVLLQARRHCSDVGLDQICLVSGGVVLTPHENVRLTTPVAPGDYSGAIRAAGATAHAKSLR